MNCEKRQKLHVFCVGLGRQFVDHLLPVLVSGQTAVIVEGICDLSGDRMDIVKKRITTNGRPLRVCFDYKEVIDYAKQCSGLGETLFVVSTPPSTHYDIVRDCVRCGFHTYVDKPLTVRASEARELAMIIRGNGCFLAVGAQRRYESNYVNILNHSSHLGGIRRMHYHAHGNFGVNTITGASEESDAFNGTGYHILDTISWIVARLGEKPRLECLGATLQRWPDSPERYQSFDALLSCSWSNPKRCASVIVSVSMIAPPDSVDELFSITGDCGEIRLSRYQVPRTSKAGSLTWVYFDRNIQKTVEQSIRDENAKADRGAPLRETIDCLLGNRPIIEHKSSGFDALRTMKLVDEIKKVARSL